MPKVSVLMPTFNQRSYIDEAVLSVVMQKYANIELVIADDASTDGTAERLAELATKWPAIKLLVSDENQGIPKNFNRGLRACTGTFVAMMGGDDVLLPGKLEAQVEWLESDDSRVLCGHDSDIFLSDTNSSLGLYSQRHQLSTGKGPERLIREGVLYVACAVMLRRSSLPAYGFDERAGLVCDWKLQVDALSTGGAYGYVPGVLCRYRRHPMSATYSENRDPDRAIAFLTDRLAATTSMQAALPGLSTAIRLARSRYLEAAAKTHINAGLGSEARRLLAQELRERPSAIARVGVLSAMSVLPPPALTLARRSRQRILAALGGPRPLN